MEARPDFLKNIPFKQAKEGNFSPVRRELWTIKFIVIHYTGNKNDTAKNNVDYFADTLTKTSAHYFVSGTDIWQSVPLDHAAYAVGLGSMKKPYIPNPDMYGKIGNSNSVSIELCGSKNSTEASDETKKTGARLASELLKYLDLVPSCVYRHYDVTGKRCPLWAVEDPLKWFEFNLAIQSKYFEVEEGDEIAMSDEEKYTQFKQFMTRYIAELSSQEATWEQEYMNEVEEKKIITGGRPKAWVTRGELAAVVSRLQK